MTDLAAGTPDMVQDHSGPSQAVFGPFGLGFGGYPPSGIADAVVHQCEPPDTKLGFEKATTGEAYGPQFGAQAGAGARAMDVSMKYCVLLACCLPV